MKKAIADRPWIWLVLGFLLMLSALAVVVVIAVKNQPQQVPLEILNGR